MTEQGKKNIVWAAFFVVVVLPVSCAFLLPKTPELTFEQKRTKFAQEDFEECMSKARAMSEREQYNSGIAGHCIALRDKAEAMQLEARTKKDDSCGAAVCMRGGKPTP